MYFVKQEFLPNVYASRHSQCCCKGTKGACTKMLHWGENSSLRMLHSYSLSVSSLTFSIIMHGWDPHSNSKAQSPDASDKLALPVTICVRVLMYVCLLQAHTTSQVPRVHQDLLDTQETEVLLVNQDSTDLKVTAANDSREINRSTPGL